MLRTQSETMLLLIVSISYVEFCVVPGSRSQDLSGKRGITEPNFALVSLKSWLAPIYVRMQINIKFHEILGIIFRVTFATKFLPQTHKHTHAVADTHFLKLLKLRSQYLKKYKSTKTRKLKFFKKTILLCRRK